MTVRQAIAVGVACGVVAGLIELVIRTRAGKTLVRETEAALGG